MSGMPLEDKYNSCKTKQVNSIQKLAQKYLFTTFVQPFLDHHVPLCFVEKDVENQKNVQKRVPT